MNKNFLEINNVTFAASKKNKVNNVTFDIKKEGEIVCLLGPSGIGKTTILRTIAGLEKVQSGKILLKGKAKFLFQKGTIQMDIQLNFITPIKMLFGSTLNKKYRIEHFLKPDALK